MRMTVYNWMCVLGIPGLFAGLIGFVRLQIKANKAMRLGVQAMLRDRLLQGYKHYLEKGLGGSGRPVQYGKCLASISCPGR